MKEYVKTDKFGCECDYLTEGKVYKVTTLFDNGAFVEIKADNGDKTCVSLEHSYHRTNSYWYFCDVDGNKIDANTIPTKTITICVEKTLRYNQDVSVSVDEYERLSNLNQDGLSKELTKLFDEDVANIDDMSITVDSYDFED